MRRDARRVLGVVARVAVLVGVAALVGLGGLVARGDARDGSGPASSGRGQPRSSPGVGQVEAALAPGGPARPALIAEPDQNRPDPFVLVTHSGYYLYSSQIFMATAPIMVSFSRAPGDWPPSHAAMSQVPAWADVGFTWSPDVRLIAGRYVLYFDALARRSLFSDPGAKGLGAQGQCIGAATSSSPAGPFIPLPDPMVCQFDHHGAIDPRSFVDAAGRLWLVWKSDDNAHFTSAAQVTHIFSQRLSADGLALVGPRYQLMQADEAWQHQIVEAPDLVHAGGGYWLFYSGGWFNQDYYAIGLARCAGPAGPCTDLSEKPWLGSNGQGQGPGEESVFRDPAGRWWIVYSPWDSGSTGNVTRPVALARLAFGPGGPHLARSG